MSSDKALRGIRILSLALNLPGPAALMRLAAMGARCTKIEPPSGDPMRLYSTAGYEQLQQGIQVLNADAKTEKGQDRIHAELAKADVLITSFRPSALQKLGLDWKSLHKRHPHLCQVAIYGACGDRADEPGHDLTYQAEADLVTGLNLPSSLYADMSGSLAATEAVLAALMQRDRSKTRKGVFREVGLAESAIYLALPRVWQMTTPSGVVGGQHAGYQVFACQDGRVAVAALETHFARSLCAVAGIAEFSAEIMTQASIKEQLAAFFAKQTRQALDQLAIEKDIPLFTMI